MDEALFPYDLGFCQKGSTLAYDSRAMDCRNVLWYHGRLFALDVGAAGVLHNGLLHEGTQPLSTVYESDLGLPICDINYFGALKHLDPCQRLFLCH